VVILTPLGALELSNLGHNLGQMVKAKARTWIFVIANKVFATCFPFAHEMPASGHFMVLRWGVYAH